MQQSKLEVKVDEKPKRPTITALTNTLILKPENYSYLEILELIKSEFPDAKTTLNCIRWHATKLRAKGCKVPERPYTRAKT